MVHVWLGPLLAAIWAAVFFVYKFCGGAQKNRRDGLIAAVVFVAIVGGIYALALILCARVSALNTLATLPAG